MSDRNPEEEERLHKELDNSLHLFEQMLQEQGGSMEHFQAIEGIQKPLRIVCIELLRIPKDELDPVDYENAAKRYIELSGTSNFATEGMVQSFSLLLKVFISTLKGQFPLDQKQKKV